MEERYVCGDRKEFRSGARNCGTDLAGSGRLHDQNCGGKIVAIDPYLTDYVYEAFKDEEGLGYKRVTASSV